jgi:hypothetical protein
MIVMIRLWRRQVCGEFAIGRKGWGRHCPAAGVSSEVREAGSGSAAQDGQRRDEKVFPVLLRILIFPRMSYIPL